MINWNNYEKRINRRNERQQNPLYDIETFEWKYSKNSKIYKSLIKLELSLISPDNATWIYDPIEYLHHLYYGEKLWAPSIFNIIWKYFHYKEYSKLNYLFREVFWWKLRDKGEKNNVDNNKTRIKRESENTQRMATDIIWFNDLNEFNEDSFSNEILETIRYKRDKMLMILSIISWKEKEEIKELIIKKKNNKNNKTWSKQIAKTIQEILDNVWMSKIKINRHLIQRM